MPNEGNGESKYRVAFSGAVAQEMVELRKKADETGRGKAFAIAFRRIMERLKTDPRNFGEYVREFHELQLIAHVGSVYPLTVRFAYHKLEMLVFIMKMTLACN
jgi:hypothetical protein